MAVNPSQGVPFPLSIPDDEELHLSIFQLVETSQYSGFSEPDHCQED
jgi:hypothetical protein